MVTVIFSSSHLPCPYFSLSTFSISSVQFIFVAVVLVVLYSPPILSRSLLTQPFHRIIGLPHLLFPSICWASGLFAILFSHSFHMSGIQSPLSVCPFFSYPLSSLPRLMLSILLANLHPLLFRCYCQRIYAIHVCRSNTQVYEISVFFPSPRRHSSKLSALL